MKASLLTWFDPYLSQAGKTDNKHLFIGKEILFFKFLSVVPFSSIQTGQHIVFGPPPETVHVLNLSKRKPKRLLRKSMSRKWVRFFELSSAFADGLADDTFTRLI